MGDFGWGLLVTIRVIGEEKRGADGIENFHRRGGLVLVHDIQGTRTERLRRRVTALDDNTRLLLCHRWRMVATQNRLSIILVYFPIICLFPALLRE
uniref:Uncharacterized protein n=1 Tax=Candidatus Kentrum sp. LFY TaxID=2126342 RepID=A0A450U6S6_9GAMM|nr:MAG: hypothetical protein BECKLFY1418B_GA0070995_100485 [Candidatus Kentron sp. LFY]VFJ87393.1 MAG: hypothetical protein BECKLFY1418A_GA0070994_100191 [Candidatus Kentron sp. LFY]